MLGKVHFAPNKVLQSLCFGILLLTAACSFSSSQPPKSQLEELPLTQTANESAVEIIWGAENTDIETYFIHYGFASDNLAYTASFKTAELQRHEDPDMGPVYKAMIPNIPLDKDLYISLQAENSLGLSPRSEVIMVGRE